MSTSDASPARDTELALATWFHLDPARLEISARDCRRPAELRGTREGLATFLAMRGFRSVAEVGVFRGEHAAALCRAQAAVGGEWAYWGIDPYSVRPDYGRDEGELTEAYSLAVQALAPFGAHANLAVAKSLEAAAMFPDGSLDAVHLDGHHNFPNVTLDLCAWLPKVRPGGIISGHDYYTTAKPGFGLHVQLVVDAFTRAYDIRPWFLLGEKDGQVGVGRDDHRSFLWAVRPTALEQGR